MKAKEIRDLTTSEIEEQIKSSKEELFNLRFQLATGQLEKLHVFVQLEKQLHV